MKTVEKQGIGRKIRYVAISILFLAVSGLIGCGEKMEKTQEELLEENELLYSIVFENEAKIAELENTIKSLTRSDELTVAITEMNDGSGKQTFHTINDKIWFNSELKYTNATQAPNTLKLNLSSRVSIVPSDNWEVKMNGTVTEYNHPSGITGVIKLFKIPEVVKAELIEDTIMKPFTDGIPYSAISSSKIFIEDNWRGIYSTMNILNNEEPAILKCGVVAQSDVGISFSFYYKLNESGLESEIINNLIRTMKFGDQPVRIQ